MIKKSNKVKKMVCHEDFHKIVKMQAAYRGTTITDLTQKLAKQMKNEKTLFEKMQEKEKRNFFRF